jgi:hypothetical protein
MLRTSTDVLCLVDTFTADISEAIQQNLDGDHVLRATGAEGRDFVRELRSGLAVVQRALEVPRLRLMTKEDWLTQTNATSALPEPLGWHLHRSHRSNRRDAVADADEVSRMRVECFDMAVRRSRQGRKCHIWRGRGDSLRRGPGQSCGGGADEGCAGGEGHERVKIDRVG